ncbi:hypothetical protein E3P99_04018 [Wallemia hederae]|uniref:NADH-cytochrome b5 reductase n=1 Tax=Wallemia hederae TaxID=1540922 RepID=A0A4T0FE29_9BASI|nr:hypothetical protein E3P99_04018 [Wallemia hederae]
MAEIPALRDPYVLAAVAGILIAFGLGGYLGLFGSAAKPVLDPKEFKQFPLVEKHKLSPNTALYRFGLPNKTDVLGLPIGQHISVQAEINGKQIMRSYTPTSSDDDKGHFDLVVKTYAQGNISLFLDKLQVGQNVRVRGPKGQFKYDENLTHHIGMIAGGTGITPMLQVIRAILKNPRDTTQVDLIYANVTVDDILMKQEIDDLVKQENENGKRRLRVLYVLNSPPASWDGGIGFVNKQMIEERFPPAEREGKVLLCGPPPMINAMKKHLDELKYPAPRAVSKLSDQIFCF